MFEITYSILNQYYKIYLENYTYLFDAEKIWDPLRVPYKDQLVSKLKKKH